MVRKNYRAAREATRDARIEAQVLQSARVPGASIGSAWRKYVAGSTTFPFVATWIGWGAAPFAAGAKLLVVGLAKDDGAEGSLLVKVMDGHQSLQVPLEHLVPDDARADELELSVTGSIGCAAVVRSDAPERDNDL